MSKTGFPNLVAIALFLLVIVSVLPPYFLIFSIFFIAIGLYIDFKSSKDLEETSDKQEILKENTQSEPNEVFHNADTSIKQNNSQAIEIKSTAIEAKKEDNIEETEDETEEEKTETFGGKINKMQSWENRTPRKDLALIVAGILFFLISSLVSGIPSISIISTIFSYLGILSILIGLYFVLKGILKSEQVIDNWSILIEKGNGKAEDFFILTEAFMKGSKAPSLRIERKKMAPGVIRGILGTSREFLAATDQNFRLNPYQIFINARDYGENLDVSWYMTYRLPFWRALLRFIPGIGAASFTLESLDLFDRQDLTAYATICHHSTLKAVEKLMLALDQDPSKIDRKSKGFLGIS